MFEKFRETVKDFSADVKDTVAEKEIGKEDISSLLEEFKLKLLENNVSYQAAEGIKQAVSDKLVGQKAGRFNVEEKVQNAIREELQNIVKDEFDLVEEFKGLDTPAIFFIGFNGSGKTTSLAKVAKFLEKKDYETVFGAGDTFRAASMEQLEKHGDKLDKKVITHEYESDPAAVAYDTIEHAQNENKVALIDTAGRSHSDKNLMDELEKMIDVNDPDITFLVIDALSGNDVTKQIEAYQGMFDAIIITKMDIDEKGGTVVSVNYMTDKPIAFKGTGQGYRDLDIFSKEEFIDNLLSD